MREGILLLKLIGKMIIALNGNVKKSQIAAGLAWGILLGLVPAGNFFWIVLFIFSFFFKHHHLSKIFSMAIVKLVSPLIVLWLDFLGWEVLNLETLQPLFTTLYNMPFVPFTKFNNTLVMGGLVGGLVLWLPSFIIFIVLITLYRNHLAPKIRNSKLVKSIAKSPLLKIVDKFIPK
jgi:uncharacterized protein (TIGR03546 family)